MTITSYIDDKYFRVYINDLIHVALKRSTIIGVNTWTESEKQYFIEYTLVGGVVKCEYDSEDKWTAVLNELNKLIL